MKNRIQRALALITMIIVGQFALAGGNEFGQEIINQLKDKTTSQNNRFFSFRNIQLDDEGNVTGTWF